MSAPDPGLPPPDPRTAGPSDGAGPREGADALRGSEAASPLLRRLADNPVPTVLGAVALAVALGVGAAQLGRDAPAEVAALPSAPPSPSPSPSATPSTTATPSLGASMSPVASPTATAVPTAAAAPGLDASCRENAAAEAVCRFVRALQTGDLDGLSDREQVLAQDDTDVPGDPFSVISCALEGDATVLCEVQFSDPMRIAAGFRLAPVNGEFDAASGDLVLPPGERVRYEVVEAVGLRRNAPQTPAPPSTPGPTAAPVAGGLVLGGDELGVTRVGAPYREAVRAVSRVLGPPVADPSATSACVGAEQLEVEWPQFRLAVSDDRVSGWSSADPRLRTPAGVGVGSTFAELQRVYGARLRPFEATPDSGAGFFGVEGVALGGNLDESGRVTGLWNGTCSPP